MSGQERALHRRRHALLIELAGSAALRSLAAEAFDTVTETDLHNAVHALADHADVSVALVDNSLGEDVGALLDDLESSEPSLPVVLISASPDERARITLGTDVDGTALEGALTELPELGGYDPQLVDAFGDAVVESIEEGFLPGPAIAGAFYKANRRHLSDVNAMLHFEGGSFSGWVSIDADHATLQKVFEHLFEGASSSDAEREDLAGEIANHIVARLRRRLPDSRPRIVSVPEIMRDKDALMRKTRIRHSLVLELTTPQGPMFAQLHFQSDAPIVVSAVAQVREAFQMF